ncbi:MAG: sugar phosphate isomerase/epimerase [Gammaproteobacteria bacterium]|nr:sugar phosphate isomerase/epimerase [Gammaproteobacteria bacterium]
MQLALYKTLWGHEGTLEEALNEVRDAGWQGIEGPAPLERDARNRMKSQLEASGLAYIAEITTAGSYVPERRATLDEHLESFEQKLDASMELNPQFITCLGACDAWEENRSIEFFARAMEMAHDRGITVSFETHRSRALFNPWVTRRIVEQLPEIRLTCDFSHWCVVCERLMDTELDVIEFIAPHAHHIHARVGYDQGPQVPHPAAPEYEYALRAHQSWWEILWQSQRDRGYTQTTMTPEFGPDGYLQHRPFTAEPVGDLKEINLWMGEEECRHFARASMDETQQA